MKTAIVNLKTIVSGDWRKPFANGDTIVCDAGRIVHVDYYRLLDEPARVMEEVHARLGIDSPEEVRAAIAEWHGANPKGARGSNPYALDQFGLDPEAVAERFKPYMDRFAIPREAAGIARVEA